MSTVKDRVAPLSGVHNFRRFCGYVGHDGRAVKSGLYRSGHFSRATEDDKAHIASLGLQVVADLRKPAERQREPSWWSDEHGVRVIASDEGDGSTPPHFELLRQGEVSDQAIHDYMMGAYRRIPMEACNQHVFREGFRALATGDADQGFVVHCAAGKDRTGLFCALVLGELGVSDEEVMADYLMTNDAVDFDLIAPNVKARIDKEFEVDIPLSSVRRFLGVHPDFLNQAFETIGGRDRYLSETLGVTPDERAALRERWLEK